MTKRASTGVKVTVVSGRSYTPLPSGTFPDATSANPVSGPAVDAQISRSCTPAGPERLTRVTEPISTGSRLKKEITMSLGSGPWSDLNQVSFSLRSDRACQGPGVLPVTDSMLPPQAMLATLPSNAGAAALLAWGVAAGWGFAGVCE